MTDLSPARPEEPGIIVEIAIGDRRLAGRIAAALRELPEVEVFTRGLGEDADITITDVAPNLSEQRPDGALVVLVDRPDVAPLRAGAAAVLPRSAGKAELRIAIEAVLHGLVVAPAGGFDPLDRPDAEPGFAGAEPPDDVPALLTAREREVLGLLSEGASNKLIARRLGVSVHTAKFHVASILTKLDATGRTDAVAHAVRLGLLML